MNYAKIRNYDIANGEGVRTSLFVSGCTNHCLGCFNPEEQNFNFGSLYTDKTASEIKGMLKDPVIAGLSLLGGDPLCQDYSGIYCLNDLCYYTHSIGKTVWLWTGFIWEDVWNPYFPDEDSYDNYKMAQAALLTSCDVVVDGPFQQERINMALKWRGSANQRIIDVRKTISNGQIILYEE